jgi:ribose 5-phosphate isomerase A
VARKRAAMEAVKLVEDSFVVGLGSGSTMAFAIEYIGNRIRQKKMSVLGVPTSYQSSMLAVKHGIQLTNLNEHSSLDLTIDGADQIDNELNLIKGMGGALTREKIVASASRRVVIVADQSKKVDVLGANNHPVPIEVLPFAVPLVVRRIKEIGGKPNLREGRKKVGPVVTDNGNVIIDAEFGPISAPLELDCKLIKLPGVIETGLFIGTASTIYIGKRTGVEELRKKPDL